MKRVLCLYIPFLTTDRLRKQVDPTARDGCSSCSGLATISPQGATLRIVEIDQTAVRLGIHAGQTLADARSIAPHLNTCPDDPEADRRQLETLAVWAQCLSPSVHIADMHTLLADVTGCARLFRGESNLLRQALEGLCAQGFDARGAIADTPGAAWAIAHAAEESQVVAPPGQSVMHLALLPVWSLRIDDKAVGALASVGVETIETLLFLPRSSLVSRFGQTVLDRMEQALGDLPEVFTPYRPSPVLTSRIEFGHTTSRGDTINEALCRSLQWFCDRLTKKVAGVCQVFVTFYCPIVDDRNGAQTRTVSFDVNLSKPTRSFDRLYSLLRVVVEGARLPAPADALMLWARRTEPLDDWQEELFVTDARDARALGDLVDRLAARLGRQAVRRPELLSEHQPELAFRYVSLLETPAQEPRATPRAELRAGSQAMKHSRLLRSEPTLADRVDGFDDTLSQGVRPLHLFARPIRISTTAMASKGPPIAFRLDGLHHTIIRSAGPERIETGWWRGAHVQRDYYRVCTDTGRRCWLFRLRDSGQWFLHGWFD